MINIKVYEVRGSKNHIKAVYIQVTYDYRSFLIYINKNVNVRLNLRKFFINCFEILTQRCIRIHAFLYTYCGILTKGPKYLRKYVCTSLAIARQLEHDSYPWKPTMMNC
jgi:hypothetical protein